jgi:hypothetical protein
MHLKIDSYFKSLFCYVLLHKSISNIYSVCSALKSGQTPGYGGYRTCAWEKGGKEVSISPIFYERICAKVWVQKKLFEKLSYAKATHEMLVKLTGGLLRNTPTARCICTGHLFSKSRWGIRYLEPDVLVSI